MKIKQPLRVVGQQYARCRHAETALNQRDDVHFLLHLPMQGVGIDFQNNRRLVLGECDFVCCGNLATMNVANGRHLVIDQDAIDDCLGGNHRHLEIGTNAHEPAEVGLRR
jgi:hypothetical protein